VLDFLSREEMLAVMGEPGSTWTSQRDHLLLAKPRLAQVETAWSREIEERIAAYDRGELRAFAAENVFAEARRNTR
jgi:hypothetical protein